MYLLTILFTILYSLKKLQIQILKGCLNHLKNHSILLSRCKALPTTTTTTTAPPPITVPDVIEPIPKATMCVLEPRAMSRSLDHEAYAQIEIITCQPHEECRPMMSGEVNIGKFGLG